jgi:hypothetical protein
MTTSATDGLNVRALAVVEVQSPESLHTLQYFEKSGNVYSTEWSFRM